MMFETNQVRLSPYATRQLRANCGVAVQHVDPTGHPIVVDVVLPDDPHTDPVVVGTRCHVHTLRQDQVGSGESERILVVGDVLRIGGAGGTQERHSVAADRESCNSSSPSGDYYNSPC